MVRQNGFKKVYLYTHAKDEDFDMLRPYESGIMTFKQSKSRAELVDYLTKLADELEDAELYFAFRRNGPVWIAYKTGQEENELKDLFSTEV